MLCFTHGLSRDAQEQVCQIFFEGFNIAGFAIIERESIRFGFCTLIHIDQLLGLLLYSFGCSYLCHCQWNASSSLQTGK